MTFLTDTIRRNRRGIAVALPSVCSAHPEVLRASIMLAAQKDRAIVIEATSNQVNQFGGYTGMTPKDFAALVFAIADEVGLSRERIVLGGDHLGPQAWRRESAEAALAKADAMMRAYVEAGFSKIHLDCSEGCAGEPANVDDAVSAERAARLAAVCEEAAGPRSELEYVVGTEVPPPGGARAGEGSGVVPTAAESAIATLDHHRRAFEARGLEAAWGRVIGLVVQPGLEFGADHIDRLDVSVPNALSRALYSYPKLSFEAHSTDYQEAEVFAELARRNFVVLKVGPALTFAYREAIYALDHIRVWLMAGTDVVPVSDVMDGLMVANDAWWRGHYAGAPDRLRLLRHFGYADRIRYYWAQPRAREAVVVLRASLESHDIPRPLLMQYFAPDAIRRSEDLRARGLSPFDALVLGTIQSSLEPYFVGPD